MSADFTVTRSIVVDAPASTVYAHVVDLRAWQAWSPWEGQDELHREYSEPSAGEGAHYAWSGKGSAGAGTMDVVGCTPGESVRIALQFTKPFKARNRVEFTFEESNGRTLVTWAMHGRKLWLMRLLGPLMSMDKMLGGDFEKGLASLKRVAEAG